MADHHRQPDRDPAAHRVDAGVRAALPPRGGRRGRGSDPPARRGAARLDLGGRPRAPPHALEPHRRVPRAGAAGAADLRPRLRVLGARGLPPPHRALAALPPQHGGQGRTGASTSTRCERHADLVEPVLERIRAEGPLGSRDFEGAGDGTDMWNWKPAKMVLEALWDSGVLAVAGRQSFQRRYDLAERVIPRAILDAPTPDGGRDAAHVRAPRRPRPRRADRARDPRALAAQGRPRTPPPPRPRARRRGLAARGAGGRRQARRSTSTPRRSSTATPAPPVLLCPFDNLLWDRPLLERLFGFRHVIEVYKREHERAYGYYVLPLLAGDRIVGRADLKADRGGGRAPRAPLPPRAGRARERRREARAGRGAPRARARARGGAACVRFRSRRRGASRCARRASTAARAACSRPCAGSASSSSTRSRPSRRRSTSSSGAGSAPGIPPSSTGCSGRSGSSSSGAHSSTRARTCRSSGRSCGGATGRSTGGSSSGSRRVPLTAATS